MLDVKFLAAGSNAEEAMSFICKLSFNLINESKGKQKIDIRCQNIDEAIKLDSELWINPKDSFMPHNLSNNRSEEDIIEIGYPGTKFSKNNNKILINFSPSLPNQLTNYSDYLQIVVEDNSVYREEVVKTWKECKTMSLDPKFIK